MERILVVDDDESVAQMIETALLSRGYSVETATDGRECLEKVKLFDPDLILLDVMMPEMNGWEVLEELEKQGLAENTRIAMLTVKTLSKKDIHRKGFHRLLHYIRKPVTMPKLFKEIIRILSEERQVEAGSELLSQAFSKEFANSYQQLFKNANRHKRILSTITDNPGSVEFPGESELVDVFVETIDRMIEELQEMKRSMKKKQD
jgi:CheY-like chemotaxis protein